MAFRDEADYIVQTSAGGVNGGDFAFDIGSDMEDVSGQWMQTSAAPSATDEHGALAGFSGNTQDAPTTGITRDGVDISRISLPQFIVDGSQISPSYTWELKRQVIRNAVGDQTFFFKIWRKTRTGKNIGDWMSNTGSYEWTSSGSEQENRDYFNRIVVTFYANAAMQDGYGQSESYQLAEDFVNKKQTNGGPAFAGIGIALLGGLALLIFRGA